MFINSFLKKNLLRHFIFLPLLFLIVLSSTAQDSAAVKQKWKFLNELYMMFPNMKGTVGTGTLPDAELDVNASDVFSHFKFGTMAYFELSKGPWAFSADITYMHLGEDVKPGTIINSGEVDVKQFALELVALRKLTPWLEAGIGGRLNSLDTKVDLVTKNIVGGGTTARSKSISQTWLDPIIVARIKSDDGKKFIYQLRTDIGGFGIGSDFAWQIQVYAGYRFSKLFQITGGYRVISADYNKGSGEDRFLYDVNTFGPVIRFGFNL